jgi:MFS family permease
VPTVIEELGYSAANAQLLTIPLYVFAVIMVLVFAFLSDKYKVRWVFVVLGYSIAVAGYIAQLAIPHPKYPGVTYGFLFPVAGGMYAGFPPVLSWAANNLAPSSKRAVGMALLISVGNMGAIAGSNVYLAREAPVYHTGFGACFGFLGAGIIMAIVLRFVVSSCHPSTLCKSNANSYQYARENKRREALEVEMGGAEGVKARYSEQELLDMGDQSPFFRYTL